MKADTKITRNGKTIELTIVKYEGQNTLASGSDGQPWVKVGKRGKWSPAVLAS